MRENIIFYYSDKNARPLRLPAKYEKYGLSDQCTSAGGKKLRKKKKFKPDITFFIRIVAFVVMIGSIGIIIDKSLDYLRDIEFNNAIDEKFEITAQENELLIKKETPVYPELPEGTAERLEYPAVLDPDNIAQFAVAYKDFRFYIYMPMKTSDIKYPVFQSLDNDYYLRRNIDGEDNLSGTLYLDYRNDFTTLRSDDEDTGILNRNNIVYGHNMQNGTMFGTLKQYTDAAFFKSNNMIYTYSATEVIAWQIFSAYETDTENYYIDTTFESDEQYVEFLQKLKNDSLHTSDVILTAESDILTLSTCHTYDDPKGRFVVHAVKVASTPLV